MLEIPVKWIVLWKSPKIGSCHVLSHVFNWRRVAATNGSLFGTVLPKDTSNRTVNPMEWSVRPPLSETQFLLKPLLKESSDRTERALYESCNGRSHLP